MARKTDKRIRFAIYTRYSSEMQNELSLEAQEERCRKAVAERNGTVVEVFSDGAKSGWSLDRDGFNQLRSAAEKRRFDAIMFWKFDRLARNHNHVVMIKILLRQEYGLKLYCVEGFSEDEDDSPYTAMMEQMLAVFSAFYSKNLSNETKRGKRQRVMKGEFNGSIAPLGYELVTKARAAKEDRAAGLYIVPEQAEIVEEAFKLYSTGDYSDADIAQWMNSHLVIQKLREGRQPVNKEMIRELLQNRVYTGRVSYAETIYKGSLGQGRQTGRKRKKWFEGKHEGFVSDELFETCLTIRSDLRKLQHSPRKSRTYILHNAVFCARCISRKPSGLSDERYGKMRPGWDARYVRGRYRCMARDRGYHQCEQSYVPVVTVDEQVKKAISSLQIPDGFQERVEEAIRNKVEHAEAMRRMNEIEEIVKRIDFSWEQGFLTPEQYTEKRNQLFQELEALRPIEYEDLMEAADLLENFETYWNACEEMAKPDDAKKQLIAKIVDKVFVYDEQVIGVALHGDFGVVIDSAISAPYEVVEGVRVEMKKGASKKDFGRTHHGNDGI